MTNNLKYVEMLMEMASKKLDDPKLREKLSALEHDQWQFWAKQVSPEVSAQRRARWKKDFKEYEALPDDVKNDDRKWADKVLDVVRKYLLDEDLEVLEGLEPHKLALQKERSSRPGKLSFSIQHQDHGDIGRLYGTLEDNGRYKVDGAFLHTTKLDLLDPGLQSKVNKAAKHWDYSIQKENELLRHTIGHAAIRHLMKQLPAHGVKSLYTDSRVSGSGSKKFADRETKPRQVAETVTMGFDGHPVATSGRDHQRGDKVIVFREGHAVDKGQVTHVTDTHIHVDGFPLDRRQHQFFLTEGLDEASDESHLPIEHHLEHLNKELGPHHYQTYKMGEGAHHHWRWDNGARIEIRDTKFYGQTSRKNKSTSVLWYMHVPETHRGKKLGSRMFNLAMSHARSQGHSLTVHEFNSPEGLRTGMAFTKSVRTSSASLPVHGEYHVRFHPGESPNKSKPRWHGFYKEMLTEDIDEMIATREMVLRAGKSARARMAAHLALLPPGINCSYCGALPGAAHNLYYHRDALDAFPVNVGDSAPEGDSDSGDGGAGGSESTDEGWEFLDEKSKEGRLASLADFFEYKEKPAARNTFRNFQRSDGHTFSIWKGGRSHNAWHHVGKGSHDEFAQGKSLEDLRDHLMKLHGTLKESLNEGRHLHSKRHPWSPTLRKAGFTFSRVSVSPYHMDHPISRSVYTHPTHGEIQLVHDVNNRQFSWDHISSDGSGRYNNHGHGTSHDTLKNHLSNLSESADDSFGLNIRAAVFSSRGGRANIQDHLNNRAWISPTGKLEPLSGATHEMTLARVGIGCDKHVQDASDSSTTCDECSKHQVRKGYVRKMFPDHYVTDGSLSQRRRVEEHARANHPEVKKIHVTNALNSRTDTFDLHEETVDEIIPIAPIIFGAQAAAGLLFGKATIGGKTFQGPLRNAAFPEKRQPYVPDRPGRAEGAPATTSGVLLPRVDPSGRVQRSVNPLPGINTSSVRATGSARIAPSEPRGPRTSPVPATPSRGSGASPSSAVTPRSSGSAPSPAPVSTLTGGQKVYGSASNPLTTMPKETEGPAVHKPPAREGSAITKAADRHGIPPNVALGLTSQESGFKNSAVSNKNARGLTQITQPALDDYNKAHGTSHNLGNMSDPDTNAEVGMWYLKTRSGSMSDKLGSFYAGEKGSRGSAAGDARKYAREVLARSREYTAASDKVFSR